jgi:thiol-disulfide isomerase/thioredoxin
MWKLKNNTIIFFYADWCGHCQTFMPIWKELKTKINTEEYNIIEMESQNPFINKIKILQGYPSIFYINSNKNITIEYTSGRTTESILNFLDKNKN